MKRDFGKADGDRDSFVAPEIFISQDTAIPKKDAKSI
jgi:hypothetical protein